MSTVFIDSKGAWTNPVYSVPIADNPQPNQLHALVSPFPPFCVHSQMLALKESPTRLQFAVLLWFVGSL